MSRTAFLVRCAADDAQRIRDEAAKQNCSISGYVLQTTVRFIEVGNHSAFRIPRKLTLGDTPRSAILVRCSDSEAERVREAAQRRRVRLNALVLG